MKEPDHFQLHRDRAALAVIDLQSRLCGTMHPDWLKTVKHNVRALIETALVLELPIFVTEQYPKGLGPTEPDIREVLPDDQTIITKRHFSCCPVTEFREALEDSERDQVLVCGMETHVCVWQTVRDLLRTDRAVFVAADAVISRTRDNHTVGCRLMERAGATLSSTETALFDLLHVAGTPEFKAIAPLIK